MAFHLSVDPALDALAIAAIEFTGVAVSESSIELRAWCHQIATDVAARADSVADESLRQAVRAMLRYGKFKASGRSKPSQEYLLRCVAETGQLPAINAPVDILNAVSLDIGLPISLLSLGKCSRKLHIRRGQAGECYVFNHAGQTLDVADLVVTCDAAISPSRPIGSPIKDSMAGKIEAKDVDVIAIVYAPKAVQGHQIAKVAVEKLELGFARFCGAQAVTRNVNEQVESLAEKR